MKKISLLYAALITSRIAYADINLYGRVAIGMERDQFSNTTLPSTGSIQDFGSYFGLRGDESLYGQTSALWQIEQFVDLTTGQGYFSATGFGTIPKRDWSPMIGRVWQQRNTLASSESYLGLQGVEWGRIRLGNLSNYMRSSMGSVDLYNYAAGANGLGVYSRTTGLMSTSIRYDSPVWYGISFVLDYSFNNLGQMFTSGMNGPVANFGAGLNGNYSGGVYNFGLGWKENNISVKWGTLLFQQVGTYASGNGVGVPSEYPSASAYNNAYASRLEFGYNNVDGGGILGLGFQVASGLGWYGWANSGGSFGNYFANPGVNTTGLDSNQYQTQEVALTGGWHFGAWTPKLSYAYGNNMMYNGNLWGVSTGSANQIGNSGYQQVAAELDWNVSSKTIVFLGYGQIWYGNTLQNIAYCGSLNCAAQNVGATINGSNQAFFNQATATLGFSHTF